VCLGQRTASQKQRNEAPGSAIRAGTEATPRRQETSGVVELERKLQVSKKALAEKEAELASIQVPPRPTRRITVPQRIRSVFTPIA
jgi:hypothetical protein